MIKNKKRECDDDCLYKGLYEGSQASLNEMARSQAEALQRNGRLRNSLILIMKRFFPDEFYNAENNMGSRFTSVDDEILLTFLTHFIDTFTKNNNINLIENSITQEIKSFFLLNNINLVSTNLSSLLDEIVSISGIQNKDKFLENNKDIQFNNTNTLIDNNQNLPSLGELFVNKINNGEESDSINPFIEVNGNNTIVPNNSDQEKLNNIIYNNSSTNIQNNPLFVKTDDDQKKNKRIKAVAPNIENEKYNIDTMKFTEMNDFANKNMPIFTTDLLPIAGNHEILTNWETSHRENIEKSNFRFLSSKTRYKQLGSLVISKDKSNSNSLWDNCVTKFRGAALYELGVLLRRIYNEILEFELNENYLILYIKTARGVTKILVLLDNVEFFSQNSFFANILSKTQTEIISLFVILTTKADKNGLSKISNIVTKHYIDNNLKANSPIVTSYSWEFADDRGSSAKLIIN